MIDLIPQFVALPVVDHLLIGAFLLFNMVAAPRLGMWMYSLFSMPGTLAHELSHWCIARVLGAQPSFPSILPKREGDYWRLGSVNFVPSLLNRIPVALAPFLLLPAGIWYAVAVMHPTTGWWYLAHGWVASSLLAGSLPSRQDWVVAMPVIVLGLVVVIALRATGGCPLQ